MTKKINKSGKGKAPAGKGKGKPAAAAKAPDVTPQTPSEVAPEVTPEIPPVTTPKTAPETAPETTPEVAPETTPETAPEATPEPSKGKGKSAEKVSMPKKLQAHLANKERAKGIFASHPAVDELYFTSDGTAFFEPQHARMHGESLEVHEFVTINRKDI